MRLIACPSCAEYVHAAESTCRHCGGAVPTTPAVRPSATILALGLALTACPSDDSSDTQAGTTTTAATESTGSTSGGTDSVTFDPTDAEGEAYGTPDTGISISESDSFESSSSSTGDATADSSTSGTDTTGDTGTGSDSGSTGSTTG